MLETLFFWKILVSIGAVVGLSLVAEHVSPKVAGILSGYPLGSAIALFFIGLEQSPEFAATAAVHTLAGFTASLVLAWGYYVAAKTLTRAHLAAGAITGIVGFMLASAFLKQLSPGLLGGTLITVAAIFLFSRLFRQIENLAIKQKVQFTRGVLLFRAGMAAMTILLITASADWFGPVWAGLFSAFPITFFPFMLILHMTYGKSLVFTVIKNYPLGLGALMCYALTVSQTYAIIGVVWGTIVAFGVATGYLILLSFMLNRKQRIGAKL
ncbi:hypothetical protein [Motiliproteus sp. MSK22-1]|uniref:hypothetical protein n=1 Tax=Motiliproteus sp. MSK22-1 TaxID=1897630 RepID=UPI0009755080|nr:hypothetical protein [Motiliproteus sp. MSK22-1]OMH31798.1 hypothetical protein BGP75_16930 [Motiliproteus sp. MSK22-1]